MVSFEIIERGGVMFKKNLEDECVFFNGEDYFKMSKRLLDVQKNS